MTKIIILMSILTLTGVGCMKTNYMTNEEMIIEVKKCEEAGLDFIRTQLGLTYKTVGIYCTKKVSQK